MIRKYILPIIAIVGVIFAIRAAVKSATPVIAAEPVAQPAHSPYQEFVAGSGIVEASTENIAIGTLVPGIVTEVFAKVGQKVSKGEPLFKIDDRDLQSELLVRKTALEVARQQLERLTKLPRPEDVPPMEARVKEAEANLADVRNQLSMRENVSDRRAVSEEEVRQKRYAVHAAEAKLRQAQSELALLNAGSWDADIAVMQAEVTAAESQVKATEISIDRLTVRAPVDGEVLQVKIRAGEYAPAGVLATPLVLLGNVDRLHVRVDVDENDAWRIREGASAEAFVRGNRDLKTSLEFVRFEPYVVPKRSLTGESTERVDTRVLQIIYGFDRAALPVYVGQQMDVFIGAAARAEGNAAPVSEVPAQEQGNA
ncbi:MAG TPA: efflux RND transporter periplasmic adaptor subunit [Candidatus Hydrogenedentes bacterium]|nr:efflux RND transporter periplasmic adaptor subunit [Candidatus Hydrogenedentota bacterium]